MAGRGGNQDNGKMLILASLPLDLKQGVGDNRLMLITKSSELASYCQELETAHYVAVDTEFMRERTYRAELCLVQLCAPNLEAVAVDPHTPGTVYAGTGDGLFVSRDHGWTW